MKRERHMALAVFLLAAASAFAPAPRAQGIDCLQCHQALSKAKVVHGALQAGCALCHAGIDATTVPHKVVGKFAKGLTAEPPGLCHQCHDRSAFEGKLVHAPVSSGLCAMCHNPHASNHTALLKKAPASLCLDCHADIKARPHVLAGFGGRGHPLGDERSAQDPLRPGKPFYCGTCHEPHRAGLARLLRADLRSSAGFCQTCHKF